MSPLDSLICPFLGQHSPLLGTSWSRGGRIHRYKFILPQQAWSLNSVALACPTLCVDERCWAANAAHWWPGTHEGYQETPVGYLSLKLWCLSAPGWEASGPVNFWEGHGGFSIALRCLLKISDQIRSERKLCCLTFNMPKQVNYKGANGTRFVLVTLRSTLLFSKLSYKAAEKMRLPAIQWMNKLYLPAAALEIIAAKWYSTEPSSFLLAAICFAIRQVADLCLTSSAALQGVWLVCAEC